MNKLNKLLSLNYLKKLGIKINGTNIQISNTVTFFNPSNIVLDNNIRIDDYTFLSAKGKINIGKYCHISRNCLICSGTKIVIMDFTGISSDCKIYGKTDNYDGSTLTGPLIPNKFKNFIEGDIYIGKHVIIGSSSIILPNTIINEGTAIGAMSLVKGTLKDWSIYIGNPIRILRERKRTCLELEKEIL
jgi:acetyltransferase-like isoleucine patch superfamily enzyme